MHKHAAGERFGKLVLVSEAEKKNGHKQWLARCDCGNEKVIRLSFMRDGKTTSCGCVQAAYRHNGVAAAPAPASAPANLYEADHLPDGTVVPGSRLAQELAAQAQKSIPANQLEASLSPHRTAYLANVPRKEQAAKLEAAWVEAQAITDQAISAGITQEQYQRFNYLRDILREEFEMFFPSPQRKAQFMDFCMFEKRFIFKE